MAHPRILVVDDEQNFREFLGEALRTEGYEVDLAGTARAGLAAARRQPPHVVLLDQNLPDRSGLEILPDLRRLPTNPVIIVITAYAQFPLAVDAVKAGAFHYIAKPFEFSDLLSGLAAASVGAFGGADGESGALAELVGSAPETVRLKQTVARVARSPVATVLVQGESGTGKELIARAMHLLSGRSARRMISVNCAALSESLLLSELFGHERGAFTDARERKKGVFETADGGTVFLDEISEMGPRAQAALLRVLEQRTVTRVGGTEEVPVDVRVVAATNRPLDRHIADGQFRADLYYRLNVVQIPVEPLRKRREDVRQLARYFSSTLAVRYGVPPRPVSPAAAELLDAYPWPGNVRELRNAIERAYVVSSSPEIVPDDLPREIRLGAVGAPALTPGLMELTFQQAKQLVVKQFEREYLTAMLSRTGGRVTRAAERAGVRRQVFQRLLSRYGLSWRDFQD